MRQIVQNLFSRGFHLKSGNFDETNGNFFHYGSFSIPRRDKTETGSEDAYIATKKLLSIADGVGGWNELGVDSSLYSKQLCHLIEHLYKENPDKYKKNPKALLIDSVSLNNEQGTCTSIILTIHDKKPIIYASNIGDSSYMIIRRIKTSSGTNLKVIFQSIEQCKSFNCPYQVGTDGDNPKLYANAHSHSIKHNDIIVLGSDGLFDNLDRFSVIENIMPFLDGDRIVDIRLLSELMAKAAFEASLDTKFKSPFSKKCQSFEGSGYGGKEDDITVIVAQVNVVE